MSNSGYLVQVKNLKKYFPMERKFFSIKERFVKAVDGVSFDVKEGEIIGIIGESGSGKTTVARLILKLLEPTEGEIYFRGRELSTFNKKQIRKFRSEVQIVFQDPYSSLNPRFTIGRIIGEGLKVHRIIKNKKELIERVQTLLEQVGLDKNSYNNYPHQFSGGQRQRIGIARALSLNPKLIICDEPTSALDVSIQAQILNLLETIKKRYNLTYLFISHDLRLIKYISDEIVVMYLGKIVEIAKNFELFKNPMHPYTKALLSAIPKTPLDGKIEGGNNLVPSSVKEEISKYPNSGCVFYNRCNWRMPECRYREPQLIKVSTNHYVSCNLYSS